MPVYPTPTQVEVDDAAKGLNHTNKTADGSPLDPNTPPWLQTMPANTAVPVITGANPPIVGSVMSCSTGTWTGAGLVFIYQWRRGAVDIAGATSSSYTVVTADKTNTLSCRVTATNSKGSVSATSAATVAVP